MKLLGYQSIDIYKYKSFTACTRYLGGLLYNAHIVDVLTIGKLHLFLNLILVNFYQ
jgi:hypothetical protein